LLDKRRCHIYVVSQMQQLQATRSVTLFAGKTE